LYRYLDDRRPQYAEFARRFKQAEAEAEATVVGNLMHQSRTKVSAAIFLLEKWDPEQWGRRHCPGCTDVRHGKRGLFGT
jgi:hypothetical protein